ncbi:MAG: hypothetical protein EP298_00080 [Gammaproteobacteria bacterium]|nr:MAG: hypothetical protein EP298_00080 [Gammaproteobacteria bacterium]UTW41590.1 hypothetical protein KFE69_08725 [bacterium SCSIO 12844]
MSIHNNTNYELWISTLDSSCMKTDTIQPKWLTVAAKSTGKIQFTDSNAFPFCTDATKELKIVAEIKKLKDNPKVQFSFIHTKYTPDKYFDWNTYIKADESEMLKINKATCSDNDCLYPTRFYSGNNMNLAVEITGVPGAFSHNFDLHSVGLGKESVEGEYGEIITSSSGEYELDNDKAYKVSFSKFPGKCSIVNGNINCSDNIDYKRLDNNASLIKLAFVCQRKSSNDPVCPWTIKNKNSSSFNLSPVTKIY